MEIKKTPENKNKNKTYRSLKEQNIGLILKRVIEDKNVTRIKISKETGVPKSSISDIVNYLISQGVIREHKKGESSIGKKPTILELNEDFLYVMAVDINYKALEVAIANLRGKIIYRKKETDFPKSSKDKTINSIFNTINKILAISDNVSKKIKIISVGTHGVVDPKLNTITKAPYLKDLGGVNLVDVLKEKYGISVVLNNSVNLGAIGEQWINYKNIKDLVYIDIENGIGAGIFINGRMFTGNRGIMGEIAYLPILKDFDCKRLKENKLELGIFESQVDIQAITRTVIKALESSNKNCLTIGGDLKDLDFGKICRHYKEGSNSLINKTIDHEIIKVLAIGIAALIAIIDTELIIINGDILLLGEGFLKKLSDVIFNITPFPFKIVSSDLKKEAHITGAIKHGIDCINELFYGNFFKIVKKASN